MSLPSARLWIGLTVAVSALAPIDRTPTAVAAQSVQSAQIASAIASFQERLHIPALSVAVVVNGALGFSSASGIVDVENGVAATPATVFRIASTSKPLAAVAAMQLAERGALDLDAPVQKYAPAFPVKRFPITTRQVLAHVSGIRNYRPGEGERTTRYNSLTDALSIFKDDDLDHAPGERFTYTTFGYTLLGVIIEGASGQSFEDYMAGRAPGNSRRANESGPNASFPPTPRSSLVWRTPMLLKPLSITLPSRFRTGPFAAPLIRLTDASVSSACSWQFEQRMFVAPRVRSLNRWAPKSARREIGDGAVFSHGLSAGSVFAGCARRKRSHVSSR